MHDSTERHTVEFSRTWRLALPLVVAALFAPGARGAAIASLEFENLSVPEVRAAELPAPSGPWETGTVTYHWLDNDRPDLVEPRARHQVIVQLWYPAEQKTGDGRAPYFPGLSMFRLGLSSIRGERPSQASERFAAFDAVTVPASKGAEVAEGADPLPVVLFSPGGNMSRHFHASLFLELASHGYLVAAMSHKYSTWDVFPSGGFLLSRDWFTEDDPGGERLTEYLAADARLAIRQLAQLNAADPANRFTDRIDLTRVAIAGHSRGGKTVARVCSTDPRVLACITLDNIGPDREIEAGLQKPQMTLRSDDARDWDAVRIAELRGFLRRNSTYAAEVIFKGASHNDFSDLPLVDPEGSPSRLDQNTSQRCIATVILGFLSSHLGIPRGSGLDVDSACSAIEVVEHARAE